MNSGRLARFGVTRARLLACASVSLALAIGSAGILLVCGCASTDPQSGTFATEVGDRNLAEVPTADLKARHAELLKRYSEIQRDVELKAGLPMGVAIRDDRALLGELYREAHAIDRELVRRFSHGDPTVTQEQVKAKW